MNRNSYSNNSHSKRKAQLAIRLQQEEKKLRNFLSSLSESTSPVVSKSNGLQHNNYNNETLQKTIHNTKHKTTYERDLEILVNQCQIDMENLIEKHKKESEQLQLTINSLMKW